MCMVCAFALGKHLACMRICYGMYFTVLVRDLAEVAGGQMVSDHYFLNSIVHDVCMPDKARMLCQARVLCVVLTKLRL